MEKRLFSDLVHGFYPYSHNLSNQFQLAKFVNLTIIRN